MEKMAKLAPVFSKTGTITAANSSGITDGAAAVVLASEAFRQEKQSKAARSNSRSDVGRRRSAHHGHWSGARNPQDGAETQTASCRDFDLIELNEAFAAQVLACDRELHFDREKLNVNGGAIALGHPIGCTGTRITVTLLHEMLRAKS